MNEWKWLGRSRAAGLALALALFGPLAIADITIAQVAPLSGVLATTGQQMALEGLNNFDLGGVNVGYSPGNRVGSRFVEVTVIGSTGKLLK
ncbi:MAG: hypothetical protein H0X13_12175 [Ramlibacter sp.]|nr:hypothetical protein [Gemmatimonadales bacterium]MBA3773209.1 hypothetical protein [Ramlibacter sp.]